MPKQIIKDGQIVTDHWQLIAADTTIEALPSDDIIVPMPLWLENKSRLSAREGKLGIWLDSDQGPEEIAPDLQHFALVAINFPSFTDGRGYSYARLLRERYDYQGDVRAIGDVLQDQLQYMRRCGFSSFAIKEGKNIEAALAGLNTIKGSYQAAVDEPVPYFRRRPSSL